MKLHLPEVLKEAFARRRSAVLALMTAVVGAVALIAWRVHFVFEFLAAEVFFALLFLALLLIIGTLYLVGAAAASPSVPRASENVKRNIRGLPTWARGRLRENSARVLERDR